MTSEFSPDPVLEAELEKYSGVVEGKMNEELGELSTPLDGRFSSVRTQETNLGNLVTDIMVAALNAKGKKTYLEYKLMQSTDGLMMWLMLMRERALSVQKNSLVSTTHQSTKRSICHSITINL